MLTCTAPPQTSFARSGDMDLRLEDPPVEGKDYMPPTIELYLDPAEHEQEEKHHIEFWNDLYTKIRNWAHHHWNKKKVDNTVVSSIIQNVSLLTANPPHHPQEHQYYWKHYYEARVKAASEDYWTDARLQLAAKSAPRE
ncbi:hypothetical protein L218DRAFT_1006538 [Marasmius fiardii PR-910]|nr:hypothetical protein L218DRAFT_1006538 [Marasmius fiardii PR-910]